MEDVRRRVFFSGRVQGVGFRYTAERIAKGFKVRGFVRNLADGRVELVMEGEPSTLDAFLQAIRSDLGGKIQTFRAEEEPRDPPLSDSFVIAW